MHHHHHHHRYHHHHHHPEAIYTSIVCADILEIAGHGDPRHVCMSVGNFQPPAKDCQVGPHSGTISKVAFVEICNIFDINHFIWMLLFIY